MTAAQTRASKAPRVLRRGDEYYTPPAVFETLGLTFDLDVASPAGGVPWIPAKRYFTIDDNALVQPWEGRVWMNPPYSKPSPWMDRFVEHRHGICLVPYTRSTWMLKLWTHADAIVMPYRQFEFIGGAIQWPVWFGAFGPECVAALARLGVVRVRP